MTKNDQTQDDIDNLIGREVQQGKETSFNHFYQRFHKKFYSMAFRYIKDHDFAEEVVNDIFMKLWKNIDKWDADKGDIGGWASVLAKHTIIDSYRRRQRNLESTSFDEDLNDFFESKQSIYLDTHDTPEKHINAVSAKEYIDKILTKVKDERHVKVWKMYHMGSYSISEISELLNVNYSTIKVWIFRCSKDVKRLASIYPDGF